MFVFGITLSVPGTVLGLPDAAAQFGLAGECYRVNAGSLLTLAQGGAMVMPSPGCVAARAGLRAGLSLVAGNGVLIAVAVWRVRAGPRGRT